MYDPFDDHMEQVLFPSVNVDPNDNEYPNGWEFIEADDEEEIIDEEVNWRADGMPDDVPYEN
jgi:hypothetical protein